MKSIDIKAVKCAGKNIVKILSEDVVLWEKKKVYEVKWEKQPGAYSSTSKSDDGFYSKYEIKNGKFYGVGDKKNQFEHGTYYVFDDGADTIKKLVYVKSEFVGYNNSVELFYFDVYIWNLTWSYVN